MANTANAAAAAKRNLVKTRSMMNRILTVRGKNDRLNHRAAHPDPSPNFWGRDGALRVRSERGFRILMP